jgi:hypothetical protein
MKFHYSHKIAAIVPAIALFFAVLPIQTAYSDCGMGGLAANNYSFVHLDLLAWQSDYAPYLMGYQVIDNFYGMSKRDPQIDDNIGEWRGRFCDLPDSVHISEVLYDSEISELQEMREVAASRRNREGYSLDQNSFAQVLVHNHCKETIDYLIYARTCEPFCVAGDKWNPQKPLSADMAFYIGRGKKEFYNTESHFLRTRYLYQMMRLAHYANDYPTVLRLYDEFSPKIKKINSIINYWILAHLAGARLKLGQRAEAAYQFAVVFRYCPSKRRQAFESFNIRTDQEWQAALNYCKSPAERGALFALRASQNKARALDDMIELYKLDPKNEHLDMLLIRETLRLEKVLLGVEFRRQRHDLKTIKYTHDYLQRYIQFVSAVARDNYARKPVLWLATEGYLHLLNGDWRRSVGTLAKAKSLAINDLALQEQIDNYTLAARIVGMQAQDLQLENEILAMRKTDLFVDDVDFDGLLHEKLGWIYQQRGNVGASFLCDRSLGELEKNPTVEILNSLITLCQKADKTPFEKELTQTGNRTIESDVWDLKGRYHLARFQLEAAADAFSHVSADRRARRFSPFSDKIKDCASCTSSDTTGVMDRVTFVQQMLDVQFRANSALEMGAPYWYKLGLGYYNMTYFGNSTGLADAYRSGRTWERISQGKTVFPMKNNPLGNWEVLDCAPARACFERARQLSWNSDRELSARAAFWVAKCDQNAFFISAENRYRTGSKLVPDVPPQYRTYFDMLRTYYSNTQFYQQVKTECKYFALYSNR